jgi:hypothetical protein
VPAETWRCPHCHKNNTVGVTACVTCRREAGDTAPGAGTRRRATRPEAMTATERERVVSAADEPVEQTEPAPTGRVRFSGRSPSRSLPGPVPLWEPPPVEPPKVSTAPPPFRSAAPPAPPAMPPLISSAPRRGTGGFGKAMLWIVGILVLWVVVALVKDNVDEQSGSTATTPEQTQVTTQPCPAEAAAWLPGQSGTLVARYQTTDFLITLCQATDGQLFYDGQVKGQPQGADTHISLVAQVYGDGYVAYNGEYTYQITGGRIVVSKSGTVLRDEVLQPA